MCIYSAKMDQFISLHKQMAENAIRLSEHWSALQYNYSDCFQGNNEMPKLSITGYLWGYSTGDRWYPLIKGQQCGSIAMSWQHA